MFDPEILKAFLFAIIGTAILTTIFSMLPSETKSTLDRVGRLEEQVSVLTEKLTDDGYIGTKGTFDVSTASTNTVYDSIYCRKEKLADGLKFVTGIKYQLNGEPYEAMWIEGTTRTEIRMEGE